MKYTLLTSFLFITALTQAQDTENYKDSIRFYQHISLGLGYQNQSFDNLNARLLKYFPKSIPSNSISIHYGGKTALNSLLFQGDMYLGIASNGGRKEGRTTFMTAGIAVDAGLFLTRPGSVRIYPFAGVSMDVPLVIAKIRTDNINFDSVLSNPLVRTNIEPVSFSNFFFSWRGGVGIDFGNRKEPQHPYTFGIKAGYKRSFHTGRWRIGDEGTFMNAPSDRLEQWFASVVLYGPVEKIKKRR